MNTGARRTPSRASDPATASSMRPAAAGSPSEVSNRTPHKLLSQNLQLTELIPATKLSIERLKR